MPECPRDVSVSDYSSFHELDSCVHLGVKIMKSRNIRVFGDPEHTYLTLLSIALKTDRRNACLPALVCP